MLTKYIEKLQLEMTDVKTRFKGTIFYKQIKDGPVKTAIIFIDVDEPYRQITEAMYDFQLIVGITPDEGTVDFNMFKDVPDDHPANKASMGDLEGVVLIRSAPGRVYWEATEIRK